MPDLLKKLLQTKILTAPPYDASDSSQKTRPPSNLIGDLLKDSNDFLRAWHQEWSETGVQAILAHSHRMNRPNLEALGVTGSVNQLNWKAASIAAGVAKEKRLLMGGVITPLPSGNWNQSQGLSFYIEQIGPLLDGGSHFILFYGFAELAEIETALEALRNLHHCPAVVLWKISNRETGITPDLSERVRNAGADVFGILGEACQIAQTLPKLTPTPDTPLAAGLDETSLPLNTSSLTELFQHGASMTVLPPELRAADYVSISRETSLRRDNQA